MKDFNTREVQEALASKNVAWELLKLLDDILRKIVEDDSWREDQGQIGYAWHIYRLCRERVPSGTWRRRLALGTPIYFHEEVVDCLDRRLVQFAYPALRRIELGDVGQETRRTIRRIMNPTNIPFGAL